MSIQVFGAGGSPQLQSKSATPTASTQYITPSSRYDGLSQVTVNGDSNLISSNIKSGTNIFGVTGNYKGAEEHQTTLSWTSSQEKVQQINLHGYGQAYHVDVSLSIPYTFTTSYLPLAYGIYIMYQKNNSDGSFSSFTLRACSWNIVYYESNSMTFQEGSGHCEVSVLGGNNETIYFGIGAGLSILTNQSSSNLPSSTLSVSWTLPPNAYYQFATFSSIQRQGFTYFYM